MVNRIVAYGNNTKDAPMKYFGCSQVGEYPIRLQAKLCAAMVARPLRCFSKSGCHQFLDFTFQAAAQAFPDEFQIVV
jgi:hypothetical protein